LEYGLFSKDRAAKLEKLKKEPLIEMKESSLILPLEIPEMDNIEVRDKEIKEENSKANNNNSNNGSNSPKLLKQASVVSTDRVTLQKKKRKIIFSPKKDQQENAGETRKGEIEINPFYKLVDLNDFLANNQNNVQIMKNVTLDYFVFFMIKFCYRLRICYYAKDVINTIRSIYLRKK
jgi:hypothetical protein